RFGQLTATGTRLSGEGRALGQGDGRLAWNGDILAVVGEQLGSIDVFRLSATGELLDMPVHAGSGYGARIASNGRDFAIAWITPDGNIATTMFTASGAITLPRTIQPLHPGRLLFGIVPKNGSYVLFYLTRSPPTSFSCTYVSLLCSP